MWLITFCQLLKFWNEQFIGYGGYENTEFLVFGKVLWVRKKWLRKKIMIFLMIFDIFSVVSSDFIIYTTSIIINVDYKDQWKKFMTNNSILINIKNETFSKLTIYVLIFKFSPWHFQLALGKNRNDPEARLRK